MKLVLTALVLALAPTLSFAEEEIDPPQNKLGPRLPWEKEQRKAPSRPQVIEENELQKHMSLMEMDRDVLAIQCRLGQFSTPCRGVEISLSDAAGTEIARAHTGTSGLVGFAGLNKRTVYMAQIMGDKYQGELQVHPGHIYVINGQRR